MVANIEKNVKSNFFLSPKNIWYLFQFPDNFIRQQ